MTRLAMATASHGDFDFNATTNTGYCKVCDLHLTSAAHAKQHLEGKKHKKEKNR